MFFSQYSVQAFLSLLFVAKTDCANILGIFFVPSISHQNVFRPIWRELSLRGHQVTVISPNILNNTSLTNLTEIDVGFTYKIMEEYNVQTSVAKENYLMSNFFVVQNILFSVMESIFQYEPVQNLIRIQENYDLVLVEALHPLAFAFGARFKAPIIAVSSIGLFVHLHDIFGNPTHPVLYPDLLVDIHGEPTFREKVTSFLFNIVSRICYHWWELPRSDRLARKYFEEDMPYLGEIIQNTSLMLMNTNPIMHTPRPNVPSIIEIGQLHINEKKPLPKDLQEYLDASTDGVVYFSLGSNVKSVSLSDELREIIIQALSELPYNVIWKWEADDLPGKPNNVLIRKWLPQQDILGHPNIKVFVTQGGQQSLEEAIANGVPMVGIPFFVDQPVNVKILEEKGLAICLNHESMTKDDLIHAILEVATNPSLKKRLQKARSILLDHPMTGLDKAIWWIEYVLRHDGAKHIRSPAADMSFFQYLMVDVVAFLLVSLYFSIYMLKRIFKIFVNPKIGKLKTN